MALTINPAVGRTRRGWLIHSVWFFAGAVIGGLVALSLVLIATLCLTAVLPDQWVRALIALVIGWAILGDLGLGVRLPYRRRQVPEWLREALPDSAVALAFGSMLGVGFITLFTYSTHLAMLLALPFVGSVELMILGITIFALGKSIVLAVGIGVSSVDQIAPRFRTTRAGLRSLRVATAVSSAAIGVLLVTG
jgi:hypothetical protein